MEIKTGIVIGKMEKMLKPKHLEKIFHAINNNENEGKIICECGCKAFKIRCYGEFCQKYQMAICFNACDGKYGQAVWVVCADCGRDYLLYDYALHSYDGFICEDGVVVSEEMLHNFTTDKDALFEVKMFPEYVDEEQFSEKVVNDEFIQKRFHLTMEDRASIWSGLVMELKGCSSGIVYEDFVNQDLYG